ncbi:MAG: SRPBCC domain-containing protein [Gammaproteobacteria bacterium]|nr:SRPBCC domain-containing protein [Gammaproteobacteria bacterium]MCP4874842.1 SRPBCC domain-containing protein [Gammaproteobacteria bacterium]MCP4982087.1 SRPBCC domain-containing protein [Gammaproteobacteria bacterium]
MTLGRGRFTIVMHVGDDKIPHTGAYLTLERPRQLVFGWESPYSTDDSSVTLDFTGIDASTTSVELTHVKFLHVEARSDHEGGWGCILDKLEELLLGSIAVRWLRAPALPPPAGRNRRIG